MAANAFSRLFPPSVVCPVCHGALAAVSEAAIRCVGCGRVYPVRDAIPVLLAAEATVPEV